MRIRPCAALGLLGLVLMASVASAQQRPSKYVLHITTTTMALPFKMPVIPNMPNIPGVTDMGAPKRAVSGEATYPDGAVAPIFVTVPGDLKLPANKLVLEVPKRTTGTAGTDATGGTGDQAGGKFEMTSKVYWHPDEAKGPIEDHASVDMSKFKTKGAGARGGPMAMDWDKIMSDLEKTATGSSDKLPKTVVGQGNYVLNTGDIAMELAGFLPPLTVTSPESLNDVKLSEGVDLQWEAVPGARGFIVQASGMTEMSKTAMTAIMWVSTLAEPPQRVRHDYEQKTTIADDLQNGILLPAGTTSCKIPAGIFPDELSMFTVNVIAVGADYYDKTQGTTTIGKIRSKWTGMKMAMGGMGGLVPAKPKDEDMGDQ